jgi:hypothetical protein
MKDRLAISIAIVMFALIVGIPVSFMWRASIPPPTPQNLSARAIYIERGTTPFKITRTGDWLDCWFDDREKVDRCQMTDLRGAVEFEDIFVPLPGHPPAMTADLQFDSKTGSLRTGSDVDGKWVAVPIVFLRDGAVLIPKSRYDEGKALLNGTYMNGTSDPKF